MKIVSAFQYLRLVFLLFAVASLTVCATGGDARETDADSENAGETSSSEAIDRVPGPLEKMNRFLEEDTPELARPVFLGLDSPDYQDEDGNTPLIVALRHESQKLTEQILESGADPNLTRNDGIGPLHLSTYYGNTELTELLLDHGASPTIASTQGVTPLHIAVGREHSEVADLLLYHGADPGARRADGMRPFDKKNDLAAYYREEIQGIVSEYGEDAVVPVLRFGSEVGEYARRYGPEVETAYEERGMDAFQIGEPELPPNAEAEIRIPRDFDYVEEPHFDIKVENTGRGDLFEVIAEIEVEGADSKEVFIGWLPPDESAERTVTMPLPDISDVDSELDIQVSFHEANGYTARTRSGVVSIADVDNRRVQEFIDRFSTTDVRNLVAHEHIDRRAVDRLIHFEEMEYTIDDVLFFASHRAISQDIVESIVVEQRVDYSNDDLISLAKENYLTRSIVESLFLGDRRFSRAELEELIELDVFSEPEVLYTYTVQDGGTKTSVGNQDGIIQPGEAPDFSFRLRNDSVFNLQDVSVRVRSQDEDVNIFEAAHSADRVAGGENMEALTVVSLLPGFEGEHFEIELIVENEQFGELLVDTVEVPVGDDLGDDPIIALNKDVVSKEAVEIFDGASSETPIINTFEAGARFEVTGELGDYYRVAIGADEGWVPRSAVDDYSPETDDGYELASNLELEEEFFENQRPEVVVTSPSNNDVIDHNEVELTVEAIDRAYGIESVAVWVNGNLLPGSDGERGLVVSGDQESRTRVTRSFALSLEEGENTIRVVAYNSRNIASHEESVTIESTGMRNPPRLFVLTAGVDDYDNSDLDLRYAADDAELMAEIFEAQRGVGLYEEVRTNVLLNEEATRERIIGELETFVGQARRHDTVVVFLAGHGIQQRDTYYFIGSDGDLDTPTRNGLDQDTIQRTLRYNVDTERALVMLDTCQSGFIPGLRDGGPDMSQVIEELSRSQGIAYMSASRGNEAARESPEWGQGAFTLAVREALLERRADVREGSGSVRINELYDYVSERVIELTDGQQRPMLSGSTEFFPLYAIQDQ